ncbi:MAG: hypothetical protein V2B18_19350 [Pseudomonadota bacterium]
MKRTLLIIALVVTAIALTVPSFAWDAMVAQGKCVSFDKEKNSLTIDEFSIPTPADKQGKATGKQLTFNIKKAVDGEAVGPTPVVGDILRIAYTSDGKENSAVRVMNVSKTDLMKK